MVFFCRFGNYVGPFEIETLQEEKALRRGLAEDFYQLPKIQ